MQQFEQNDLLKSALDTGCKINEAWHTLRFSDVDLVTVLYKAHLTLLSINRDGKLFKIFFFVTPCPTDYAPNIV